MAEWIRVDEQEILAALRRGSITLLFDGPMPRYVYDAIVKALVVVIKEARAEGIPGFQEIVAMIGCPPPATSVAPPTPTIDKINLN